MKIGFWRSAAAGLLLLAAAGCDDTPNGTANDGGSRYTPENGVRSHYYKGTTMIRDKDGTGNMAGNGVGSGSESRNSTGMGGTSNKGISPLGTGGANPTNDGYQGGYSPGTTNRFGAAEQNGSEKNPTGMDPRLMHRNTRMELSPYLSGKIAEMPEVKAAHAVVTDTSVYVAVQLEEEAAKSLVPAGQAEGSGGAPSGLDARHDTLSGIVGNSYDYYNQGPRMNHSGLPDAIRERIVKKVHSLSSPHLQHVFVTANPEFFRELTRYTTPEVSIRGLNGQVEIFNALASRLFPATSGTGAYGGSTSSGSAGNLIGPSNGELRTKSGVVREQ
ncbi:YhcN/YlaJ family sporulation lipoprotein [Paenibacillus aurantius]|uniref:YhcN/YlaJ family sporulation lipoprotein n=1 Tax=Paenibacillus aurantius TaxID=2918900 RepID=A0AA96LHL5_9BACL|nr:YhcN/YlaJ family sporulation lipoprotein [Paenibacillus aurantius]WNQ13429.1 YhcN/YlaJ family sporulation lipoprotein [Paenibacillus aurantius]